MSPIPPRNSRYLTNVARVLRLALTAAAMGIVVCLGFAAYGANPPAGEAAYPEPRVSLSFAAETPTPEPGGVPQSGVTRGTDESNFRPAAPAATATVTPSPSPTPAPTATPAPVRRVVALDPGHGGAEVGAAYNGVVEKDSNLEMALRVESLLRQRGLDVVLTRRGDERAASSGPSWIAQHYDLQARVDIANAARADVFVSIHSNGSENSSLNGVEAWSDPTAARGLENDRLASLLKNHVLAELRAWGYAATDRGVYDASCWVVRGGQCFGLFVVSRQRAMTRQSILLEDDGDPDALGLLPGQVLYSRAVNMPAALIELLMITNPTDAAIIASEGGRRAMAKGIADAVTQFLNQSCPPVVAS